jgi:predicted pyridoxine 5'-phosphate oxidase superfamily flavin-nucleotide-binding protein
MTTTTTTQTKPTRNEDGTYTYRGMTIRKTEHDGWIVDRADGKVSRLGGNHTLSATATDIDWFVTRAVQAVATLDANGKPTVTEIPALKQAKDDLSRAMNALCRGHFSFTTSVENRPAYREGTEDITLETCVAEMAQQLDVMLVAWQTANMALASFKAQGWTNADLVREQELRTAQFTYQYAMDDLRNYNAMFGAVDPAGLGDAIAEYLV